MGEEIKVTIEEPGSMDVSIVRPEIITVAVTGAMAAMIGGGVYHFQDVRAASLDYIHSAINGTGSEQEVTTEITNPDVPRNASITATSIDTPSGNVKLDGVNAKGEVATENIAIIPGETAYGNVAWSTLNKITLPAGVSDQDTVKVGISDKLGLNLSIINISNVIKKKINNVDKSSEISGKVDVTYNTLDCGPIQVHADITIWTKYRYA